MWQIVTGHSLEEYMSLYGDAYRNGDLWDFAAEDVFSEAVEPTENMIYWLIDNRLYETEERIK